MAIKKVWLTFLQPLLTMAWSIPFQARQVADVLPAVWAKRSGGQYRMWWRGWLAHDVLSQRFAIYLLIKMTGIVVCFQATSSSMCICICICICVLCICLLLLVSTLSPTMIVEYNQPKQGCTNCNCALVWKSWEANRNKPSFMESILLCVDCYGSPTSLVDTVEGCNCLLLDLPATDPEGVARSFSKDVASGLMVHDSWYECSVSWPTNGQWQWFTKRDGQWWWIFGQKGFAIDHPSPLLLIITVVCMILGAMETTLEIYIYLFHLSSSNPIHLISSHLLPLSIRQPSQPATASEAHLGPPGPPATTRRFGSSSGAKDARSSREPWRGWAWTTGWVVGWLMVGWS